MENVKDIEKLQAIIEGTIELVNEAYADIDLLNSHLQDLVEVLDKTNNVNNVVDTYQYQSINEFFMALPTWCCMDDLLETLGNINDKLSK